MNHPEPSQTFFKPIIFSFSVSSLEKKVAEMAKEKRFFRLKMVAGEEQKNEMIETENQKEQLEIEIADVDEKSGRRRKSWRG